MSDPVVSHTVLPAEISSDCSIALGDKRAAFRWPVFAVDDVNTATLSFKCPLTHAGRLRLALAIDVREPATLGVRLQESGQTVREVDLSYADPLQLIDLPLTAEQAKQASSQGLVLQRVDSTDHLPPALPGHEPDRRLFFFATENESVSTYATFAPRLIAPAKVEPLAAFMARLMSQASLAPFGWMEAAVLDAFIDWGKRDAVQQHLQQFFEPNCAVYEDAHSIMRDSEFHGLETGAMYGCLARVQPKHPAIDTFLQGLNDYRHDDGAVREQAMLAEHAHSIAYPLAVIGKARKDPRLIQIALQQLRLRRDRLRVDGNLYGRLTDSGRLQQPNDGRATALYLLGLVRTLCTLGREQAGTDDLLREAQLVAHWAIHRQGSDGLWPAVLQAPADATTPKTTAASAPEGDTITTAAIAAALALMAASGMDDDVADPAKHALGAIFKHLTPDGMLAGAVATHKRLPPDSSAGERRVIRQAAMGFTGQLLAALNRLPKQ